MSGKSTITLPNEDWDFLMDILETERLLGPRNTLMFNDENDAGKLADILDFISNHIYEVEE